MKATTITDIAVSLSVSQWQVEAAIEMNRLTPCLVVCPDEEMIIREALHNRSDITQQWAIAVTDYAMRRNMSQADIARRLGVSASIITEYRKGRRTMPRHIFRQIETIIING